MGVFLSRQSEKFLIGQSRKFLLTAASLGDGANRNEQEWDRLHWLKRARRGSIRQRPAAKMGITHRWVGKLLLRGRSSNRRIEEEIRQEALRTFQQPEWHDFGPTFAAEQLAKRHWDRGEPGHATRLDDRVRLWKSRPWKLKKSTIGRLDGVAAAGWCNGTPRLTIGSRAAGKQRATWRF